MNRSLGRSRKSRLQRWSAAFFVVTALAQTFSAAAEPLQLTVVKVEAVLDDHGRRILEVKLTSESGKALAELTGSHIGKRIAISLKGKILASPFIYEPIIDGGFWLSPFDEGELDTIIKRLSDQPAALQVEVQPDL